MASNKFGWDLPPGVTTSMLPGNSREEAEAEAMAEAIDIVLEPILKYINKTPQSERDADEVNLAIMGMLEKSYAEGYKAGLADAAMAQEFEKREEKHE